MYRGKTLFAQLMDFLPWTTFARIVRRYHGNRRVRRFPCTQQFRALAFGQITGRTSLRGLATCLAAQPAKLYHCGFTGPVRLSTLARANARRDWRIHADFAQRLMARARALHSDTPLDVGLADTVYALDSSTIDLCLSLFPWANFRATKAAVKLHTLLDLRGSIPRFLQITDGKFDDVNVLDILAPEPGAIYVMDRADVDFQRLYLMHRTGAFFVTRAKKNLKAHRVYSHPSDRPRGVLADQTIALDGPLTRKKYPEKLRRVRYKDPDTGRSLVFLTNRTDIDALTVCNLYQSRWQVELFFKSIKQHLRIKRFYGTSENAVKTQLWVAFSVYTLMAIIRRKLDLQTPLNTMLQILSVTPFERMDLNQALTVSDRQPRGQTAPSQLSLFPPEQHGSATGRRVANRETRKPLPS